MHYDTRLESILYEFVEGLPSSHFIISLNKQRMEIYIQ